MANPNFDLQARSLEKLRVDFWNMAWRIHWTCSSNKDYVLYTELIALQALFLEWEVFLKTMQIQTSTSKRGLWKNCESTFETWLEVYIGLAAALETKFYTQSWLRYKPCFSSDRSSSKQWQIQTLTSKRGLWKKLRVDFWNMAWRIHWSCSSIKDYVLYTELIAL